MFETGSRLERIEERAFCESGLKSIEIPSGVRFIDGSAFCGVSLDSISMSRDTGMFRLRELFLEDFDGSTIWRYFGACSSVAIPWTVVVLEKGCFSQCLSLECVVFEAHSRIERILDLAFSRSGLVSVLVPASVVLLGKWCFSDCRALESVAFANGSRLECIEEYAFCKSGLKLIAIPSSVVVLGQWAFFQCQSLESVVFENGSRLERIEKCAFFQSGLRSIGLPPCVGFVHPTAFSGTPVRF
jgi:hypothetical protein